MKGESISFDEFELRRKSMKMFLLQGYFSNAFELLDENITLLNMNIKEIQTYSKRKFKDLDSKREAKKETQISNKIDQTIMQTVRGLSEALLLIQDFKNFKFTSKDIKISNIKLLDSYIQTCKQIQNYFIESISKIMSQDKQIIGNTKNSINVANTNNPKSCQNELKEEFINAPQINEIDYLESVINYRQDQIKLIEKTLHQIEEFNKIFINQITDDKEEQINLKSREEKSVLTIRTESQNLEKIKNKNIGDGPFQTKSVIMFLIGLLILLILISISK